MAEVASNRTLLSSNLSDSTLRKIAWFLNVPTGVSLDDYFNACPTREEGEVLTTFSKYTRVFAGEDPEAPPDDAEDERRIKQLTTMGMGGALGGGVQNDPMASLKSQQRSDPAAAAGGGGVHAPAVSSKAQHVSKKRKTGGAASSYALSGIANGSAPAPALAVQYAVVEENRKVAAKLDDQWTMMTVLKYNKRTKAYILQDADDQADSKDEHEVPRDLVVPLASPEYTPPVFTVGTRVLGVYPGTTVFYPAVVNKTVRRPVSSAKQNGKPVYDYYLQFDDDDADGDGEIIPKKIKCDFVVEEVA